MAELARKLSLQRDVKNRLLEALPTEDYVRVQAHLHSVELTREQILHHAEAAIEHVYFPQTAVLSFVFISEDGVSLEVGTVGNNGLAGVSIALGVDRTPNHTEVLMTGTALRMSTLALRNEVERGGKFPKLLYAYAQAVNVHAAQAQVCLRLHTMEERLAGWLLLLHNLRPQETLPLTQRAIGQMLGVRRRGVSESARQLQTSGLISYSRGQITICDPSALEDFACHCSQVIHQEYERVFSA